MTGHEHVPLLHGGTVMKVRDIPTANVRTAFPMLRAGKTGLSCTAYDILNTLAVTDALPLANGGGSVTVAQIRAFA